MNILTWHSPSQDGAYQRETVDGTFSDFITVKPTFSFEFTDMSYNDLVSTYTIDNVPMTDTQKAEVLTSIEQVEPPIPWLFGVRTRNSRYYLQVTDWYVTRKTELGIDIPSDVSLERQAARDTINALKISLNYTPPSAIL